MSFIILAVDITRDNKNTLLCRKLQEQGLLVVQ